MESMRSINRVMEREIAKGSSPLKLDHIKFEEDAYQEITSEEKLLEVVSYLLRIGEFSQYAQKSIINNVYMDVCGKKPVFKRTKIGMERSHIFMTIKKYIEKHEMQYHQDVYLETVRCYFTMPPENMEKCQYTYQGYKTYAFPMSDKYIMALYTHCLVSRKEAAIQEIAVEDFTKKEYQMVRLENMGDVLFQALLFDDVEILDNKVCAKLCTCYWIK